MTLLLNPGVPEKYPEGYYETWDYYLWTAAIIIGFIVALVFFMRMKRADNEIQKNHYKSLSVLFFFLSLTRISYNIAMRVESVSYDTFTLLGYTFSMIGLTFFMFIFENSILTKTKHIFQLNP